MRINEKEWENIDFRRKKYKQLKESLDEVVTGRDNKVSAFVFGEGERYSTKALDKLVDELIKCMDEYARRHGKWIRSVGPGTDDEAHMPEKFREFMNNYLYCIIRLMVSDMEWVEKVFTWPFEDSFQEILTHSIKVKRLAIESDRDKFLELWSEAYYGARGDGSLFDLFTLAYESLMDADIKTTMSPEMKEMVESLCAEQNEAYEKYLEDAEADVMSDEEIQEALRELAQDDNYFEEDEEINSFMDKIMEKCDGSEENFKKSFIDADIYCKRYIRLREIFYMESRDEDMRYAMAELDDLVEGMLDVFLCRRGMSLYADVNEFVKSYTYIKRQLDRIRKLREEV